MTHPGRRQPTVILIGAAVLALGMSAFLFYEPGPGRAPAASVVLR